MQKISFQKNVWEESSAFLHGVTTSEQRLYLETFRKSHSVALKQMLAPVIFISASYYGPTNRKHSGSDPRDILSASIFSWSWAAPQKINIAMDCDKVSS